MEYILYLGTILLILFTYHVYSIQFSTRKLPPGPVVAPFGLGAVPWAIITHPKLLLDGFSQKPWVFMDDLAKKYGPFFSFPLGPFDGGGNS
ncbi:unnamed protein product [Orchesella dallaii]|uniref:Cytochrome P450 n=1 Tax=Orchesella dallaii TaxID=48710 RepID=A0ABP1S9Y0_9HEXA